MGGDRASSKNDASYRRSRIQTKTGCRTCKIRKVKCDEGRPACRRCVSTGRACDGYGIWGGGGSTCTSGPHRFSRYHDPDMALLKYAYTPLHTVSAEECMYFDWFRDRSSRKLPGTFISAFWDTLLCQASLGEPAVMHAVMSLGSVHKRDICVRTFAAQQGKGLDTQERFTLQHYTKAIEQLQPHLSSVDKSSARVTLITCFVFVCIELLCGRFASARAHLQNGLQILRTQTVSSGGDDVVLFSESSAAFIDNSIFRAFCRLQFQMDLFGQRYQHPRLVLQTSRLDVSPSRLTSINAAWEQIESLFSQIILLTDQGRQMRQVADCSLFTYPPSLLAARWGVQANLSACLKALKSSRRTLESYDPRKLAYRILFVYHTMACIMADACLDTDETVYDYQTQRFVSILNTSIAMRYVESPPSQERTLPGSHIYMSKSIIDIGWIAPLYYTALKCRIHRVRLHAIRLLESTSYREGIWESKMAACVARKAMELEGDTHKPLAGAADFAISSPIEAHDLSLPRTGSFDRVKEVQLVLSDNPTDTISVLYKRGEADWKEVQIAIQ